MGEVTEAPPYPGAKLYFLITDQLNDQSWIATPIRLTADALPAPVKKKPMVSKTKKVSLERRHSWRFPQQVAKPLGVQQGRETCLEAVLF
jgi:hypothetical protein